jgi:hypothetical protein
VGHFEVATGEIYRKIRKGDGNFEEFVKRPLLLRDFDKELVRQIIRRALVDSRGKYRTALRLLRVPDKSYAVTIQFLKRNDCYLDFRPFRKAARAAPREDMEDL